MFKPSYPSCVTAAMLLLIHCERYAASATCRRNARDYGGEGVGGDREGGEGGGHLFVVEADCLDHFCAVRSRKLHQTREFGVRMIAEKADGGNVLHGQRVVESLWCVGGEKREDLFAGRSMSKARIRKNKSKEKPKQCNFGCHFTFSFEDNSPILPRCLVRL
jgi:hypothetical protein